VRVVTYNLLFGGARRQELIRRVLARADADVIALQEASDTDFIERLASELGMTAVIGAPSERGSPLNLALLSRLPILRSENRQHRGKMLRSHLECDVAAPDGNPFRVHCVHLVASFGEKANGEVRRLKEIEAVLTGVAAGKPMRHLVIGDFNAVAPGDVPASTLFLTRMARLRRAGLVVRMSDGMMGPRLGGGEGSELESRWLAAGVDPRLDVGVPKLPRVFSSLTGRLPLSPRIDRFVARHIEHWTVERLLELSYIDCFRQVHPRAAGYTCATWLPAARIDYVFASPELAPLLERCEVVGSRGCPDPDVPIASDHHPLLAEFRV
jgi:endonuclease/exonuclease/phosphatase family metal-dependent hydrolase